jgi:hypothetical protein
MCSSYSQFRPQATYISSLCSNMDGTRSTREDRKVRHVEAGCPALSAGCAGAAHGMSRVPAERSTTTTTLPSCNNLTSSALHCTIKYHRIGQAPATASARYHAIKTAALHFHQAAPKPAIQSIRCPLTSQRMLKSVNGSALPTTRRSFSAAGH